MFDEKMSRFEALIDEVARVTPPSNRQLHELLMLAGEAIVEIRRLGGEIDLAWADGDLMAWRRHASEALGSLIVKVSHSVDGGAPEEKKMRPQVLGVDGDRAIQIMAELAERYGDAMTERDRLKRKAKT